MKLIRITGLALLLSVFCVEGFAQVTSIPETAKSSFATQYPNAQNVEWDNDVVNVNVRFDVDGKKMNAEYNNKGVWKHTYQDHTYDQLPMGVQDGYKKSKFADREVTEVKKVFLPGNVEQYRLKVEKNDVQKKFLYFNPDGRLVRDANTI
jgi:hypothetical protein